MASTSTAIVKWNEVGTALVLYTEKQDEKTLGECIQVMVDGVSFVAPYASVIYGFVKPMVIPDPVMVELNKINEKLNNLDKKLDKIVSEIKEEFKISEYNTYLNKMHTMQALYTRFIQTPNTVTSEALKEQGKKNEMFDFINYLHREVIGQSLNPIIKFMKSDEDYPKFIKWTQLILANYAQAMFLHGISVRFQTNGGFWMNNSALLDKTLAKDMALFEINLREIGDEFTNYIKYLTKNYLRIAKRNIISEIDELPRLDGSSDSDQKVADLLYNYLNIKHPFRQWFVCVVNYGYDIYLPDSYVYFEEEQGICLVVCLDGSKRIAMDPKEYLENKYTWRQKWGFPDFRYLLITSTLNKNTDYKDGVKKYLDGIDETKYCKNDGWLTKNSNYCSNVAKIVLEGMPKQYSSKILCFKEKDDSIISPGYRYKYNYDAQICIHKRDPGFRFGENFEMCFYTFKKD